MAIGLNINSSLHIPHVLFVSRRGAENAEFKRISRLIRSLPLSPIGENRFFDFFSS